MKALSDLFAVILFFAAYMLTKNIIWATAVAILVGVIQAAWLYVRNKKLEPMQWLGLVLIVVFGGATVILQDAHFIMWKPTVLFWAGACAMAVGYRLGKQPLKALMGKELDLPDAAWRKLTLAWMFFLLFMGALNLAVAYGFSEAQWVTYKMFGSTALMLVFLIAQGVYMSRYLTDESGK